MFQKKKKKKLHSCTPPVYPHSQTNQTIKKEHLNKISQCHITTKRGMAVNTEQD